MAWHGQHPRCRPLYLKNSVFGFEISIQLKIGFESHSYRDIDSGLGTETPGLWIQALASSPTSKATVHRQLASHFRVTEAQAGSLPVPVSLSCITKSKSCTASGIQVQGLLSDVIQPE